MPEFLRVKSADEVLAFVAALPALPAEPVPLEAARGRVLAAAVAAPEDVPHFHRATMDGYAVRARDTFGASESLPALLSVIGSIAIGTEAALTVGRNAAAAIPTGGMLPGGADAVVMIEHTQAVDAGSIEVTRPVAPGENVLARGEDMRTGAPVFPSGWRLRPQDVGTLAALGIGSVLAHRRPRVAVLSTGDEIVAVETRALPPGKVRDINTWVIAAQAGEAGAVVGLCRVIPDDLSALIAAAREALLTHDMVLLSGGSSVGMRDYTLQVLDALPGSELLVHGVAIRPGKPTLLARAGEKVLWGLPGQPTSAMIVFTAFVAPSLARLEGEAPRPSGATRTATLAARLPSVHGRADYLRVRLSEAGSRTLAHPVFGKSAMISTLSRADGFVIVPEHVEGLDEGVSVTVHLFSAR